MVLLGAVTLVQQGRRPAVPRHLESSRLAPGTINLGLGLVRCLAYEASDCLWGLTQWQTRFLFMDTTKRAATKIGAGVHRLSAVLFARLN